MARKILVLSSSNIFARFVVGFLSKAGYCYVDCCDLAAAEGFLEDFQPETLR